MSRLLRPWTKREPMGMDRLVSNPKALDLFCGAGGVSEGLRRACFDVVGVDLAPQPRHRGGVFVQGDALTYPLEGFDFLWASPPCQSHSSLRHINPSKVYPCHIEAIRNRFMASGIPWVIENVPGAPLGKSGNLLMLCGSMFGLETPDDRAELRRHRHFELSFPVPFQPECRHGQKPTLSVAGHAYDDVISRQRNRVITVLGDRPNSSNTPRVICVGDGKAMLGGIMTPESVRKRTLTIDRGGINSANTPPKGMTRPQARESFSVADARAAMGIEWMPMKSLSQAIPPAYAEFIGRAALGELPTGAQASLWYEGAVVRRG